MFRGASTCFTNFDVFFDTKDGKKYAFANLLEGCVIRTLHYFVIVP